MAHSLGLSRDQAVDRLIVFGSLVGILCVVVAFFLVGNEGSTLRQKIDRIFFVSPSGGMALSFGFGGLAAGIILCLLSFMVYDAAQSIFLPSGATLTGRDRFVAEWVQRRYARFGYDVVFQDTTEPVRQGDVERIDAALDELHQIDHVGHVDHVEPSVQPGQPEQPEEEEEAVLVARKRVAEKMPSYGV